MADRFSDVEQGGRPDDTGMICLAGTIEHVIFSNEDNGFAICDLGIEGDELVTVTGILPFIGEGDTVTVYGRWVHNPKYGRQFRVERAEKQLPADRSSILRYLSSGGIKGIGPKTAQKIVDEFGDETFDVIEHHPDWLTQIGITKKRAEAIAENFREQAGIRAAMLFFREFFGPAITVRIYKTWGNAAVDRAKKNPYLLCEEIDGIGFERADRLALRLGMAPDSEERLCSGICYLLNANAQQNGHTCLPREKLIGGASKLLEAPPDRVEAAVDRLLREKKIVLVRMEETDFLYDKFALQDEQYIAHKLVLLDRVCPSVDATNVGAFIAREERENGIQYAALQRKAIADALQSGVMLLTGGPGTGKTTVVRALLHIFDSMEYKVALCAPTGRAAKRLSESTSCEAKTIHRLLEYGAEDGRGPRFNRDEKNLLDENAIIVDEASMVDNRLMSALLHAVKPGARVIIIGDADQLPSVGAGNVLRDLIESEAFSTVRLDEIFRQAQKSMIVTNAHAINHGEMPRLDVKDNDFFFLPRESDREIAATVAQLCKTRLPNTYGEMARRGTQVISPSRKGETGTENLNVLLQEALNPPSKGKAERKYREITFRVGDRVMQTKNNYDLEWEREDGSHGSGVFNGDIGTVTSISTVENEMEILFDDRTVSYGFDLLEELELAYAVTVHKSQGSEYPIVIIPAGNAPALLLSRNLLYTAVTRAQTMVILVGRESVVREMVANRRQSLRYTGLVHRLKEVLR